MKRFLVIITVLLAAGFTAGTTTAETPLVGVVTPQSGSLERLGNQLSTGVLAAAKSTGQKVSAIVVDDGCTSQGGSSAARRLVETNATIVVGFLCSESIQTALPILSEAGIPVITPAVRANALTDRRNRTGWLVYRTAPRADDERQAVGEILTRRWADELFAIVDDGTIYGRELAESFRLAAEQAGLKPVFTDTYRPQLDNQIGLAGRLRRAGATHVFAGGDRYDIAVLARDAKSLGYSLVIAGGEALRAAPGDLDLAAGTLMIGLPTWDDIADDEFRYLFSEAEIVPEGYVLPGFAAAQVAIAAIAEGERMGRPVTEVLDTDTFATAAGSIRFNEKGDRVGNQYRLFRYDGNRFVEVKP